MKNQELKPEKIQSSGFQELVDGNHASLLIEAKTSVFLVILSSRGYFSHKDMRDESISLDFLSDLDRDLPREKS